MTSSHTPTRSPWQSVLDDFTGITENLTVGADSTDMLRELLIASGMTLKNPAGIFAASARLVERVCRGRSGPQSAARSAVTTRGRSRSLRATSGSPMRPIKRIQRISCWLNSICWSASLLSSFWTSPVSSRIARSQGALRRQVPGGRAGPDQHCLPGNPAAIRKAFDTGGKSVVQGPQKPGGRHPATTAVGRHKSTAPDSRSASTWPPRPGAVVYRSDLIELIQYSPQTPETHAVPLLFCPPWINKYYIMDLAPGKSLIEWAVQHGHTCFAISYRNPDAVHERTRIPRLFVSGTVGRCAGCSCNHGCSSSQHRLGVSGWNAHRTGAGLRRRTR